MQSPISPPDPYNAELVRDLPEHAYYFTPAQLAAHSDSGIDSIEGLAGATICMGEATTYLEWMGGTLDFGTASPETAPPEGSVATTLPTDRNCAEAWGSGRKDFEGWLSSGTTVQAAIDDGLPIVAVGEPVFYEPLAAAFDKGVDQQVTLAMGKYVSLGQALVQQCVFAQTSQHCPPILQAGCLALGRHTHIDVDAVSFLCPRWYQTAHHDERGIWRRQYGIWIVDFAYQHFL